MAIRSATQSHSGVPITIIEVAKVAPANAPLPEVPYKVASEALLADRPSLRPGATKGTLAGCVEACSRYHGQLVADVFFHPVVAAIGRAFHDHRPLVLSPDMLWLLVAQGFANHINVQAEELRPRFVTHVGKLNIKVRRDDFVKGSPENPWPEVFVEFSRHIRKHIGAATHDLLLPNFSTTGVVDRAAAEVVLFDAMQSFFTYECYSACGIPQILLEGTSGDWVTLAQRTRSIGEFGLGWWTEALAPILEEFVAASRGEPDARFWQSIYKWNGSSGGPYISGWITAFFPYLRDWKTKRASRKNPWLTNGGEALRKLLYPSMRSDDDRFGCGPTTEEFPGGLARAPFLWHYHEHSFEMEFLGGFVGVRQEADSLRLRPEIGWMVRESGR